LIFPYRHTKEKSKKKKEERKENSFLSFHKKLQNIKNNN